MEHKKHEKYVCRQLNNLNFYSGNFELNPNNLAHYDISNDEYLIELKWRKNHYSDQLAELLKFGPNCREAEETGRDYIYAVRTTKGFYFWNITKMLKSGWEPVVSVKKLPATTAFSNRNWIDKDVFYLEYADATEFKLEDR